MSSTQTALARLVEPVAQEYWDWFNTECDNQNEPINFHAWVFENGQIDLLYSSEGCEFQSGQHFRIGSFIDGEFTEAEDQELDFDYFDQEREEYDFTIGA